MLRRINILILLIVICGSLFSQSQNYYIIPKQTNNLYELFGGNLGLSGDTISVKTLNTFEITTQIKLCEYKNYLDEIKTDSSSGFYLSQLPDSTVCSRSNIILYFNDQDMQNEPIVGISWESAMSFCKWKTIKENGEKLKFIYRLPSSSEWVFAYDFLQKSGLTHDFNYQYSDWLINSKDDGKISLNNLDNNIYFANNNAPQVLKRKIIIGNSYLFKQQNFIDYFRYSYYSNMGYPQTGFRCVKVYLNDSVLNKKTSINQILIEHWHLETKTEVSEINNKHTKDGVFVCYEIRNHLLNGYYYSKYKNGEIKSTGYFKNNQKIGIWSIWDNEGKLKNQRYYVNNYEFETIFPNASKPKTIKYISNPKYELSYNSDNYIEYFNPDESQIYKSEIIWSSISAKNNQDIFNQDILNILYEEIKYHKIICFSANTNDTIKHLPLIDTIELSGIKLKELWYFDTYRFISEKRIINFIPQIKSKNSNKVIDLGVFNYSELRKAFAKIKIKSQNSQIKTLDDLFFFNYFVSKIYKSGSINSTQDNYIIELLEKENNILLKF